MSTDVAKLLSRHARATHAFLQTRLPELLGLHETPPRLREAIDYSLLAGGKRLRPALVREVAHVCGADPDDATAAGAAIELIHTFSLVHDDLPAMDDDDVRRGKPSNHKVFGESLAVLAGDAMTTLAFELLSVAYADRPGVGLVLVRELAGAAGPLGMIGGQTLDIEAEGQSVGLEQLRDIHRLKTGALIRAACRMGAVVAESGDTNLRQVTRYGESLGVAFQIADDLLDVTATPEAMGKATHKDAAAGKNTYPALLGLEGAREAARREADAAVAALDTFGPVADGLRNLARYTVERTS